MPDLNQSADLASLTAAVRYNCAVSDAKHSGQYSLCIYLLKMRELFRWEQGLDFSARITPKTIGTWLDEREALWDALEDSDYQPLPLAGQYFDPFDSAAINTQLVPQGLVYSAGYGRFGKPSFCLARLEQAEHTDHYTLYIAGPEYARDLAAMPAMALDETIYIRRESLRRAVWELVEEGRGRKNPAPITRVLDAMRFFEQDLDSALDALTDHELDAVILHEIGELTAGQLLGETWNQMLWSISCSKAEIMARAVRDLLADCVSVLPALLYERDYASLHFYFANFNAMRRELFPLLAQAYQQWLKDHELGPLKQAVRQGQQHWLQVAEGIIQHYQNGAESAQIEAYISANKL